MGNSAEKAGTAAHRVRALSESQRNAGPAGPLFAKIPRVTLAHLPTPLGDARRLSEELGGPRILIKRDDCTGLAIGGNKVRKLEFLLGEAIAEGCDTILTTGGVQSNHARQTAAACAHLGLRCELVLPRMVPRRDELYESGGNLLLDKLLGARVHLVDDIAAAESKMRELQDLAARRGGRAAVLPAGGSTPTGALGYAAAASEIVEQLADAGITRARIFVAAGTCGTLAGLLAGLGAHAEAFPITAIAVLEDATASAARADTLARACSTRLGNSPPPPAEVLDGFLGDGYGMPTDEMHEAVELCARREGLLLDPVYTGKAMAGMIEMVRAGKPGPGETAVFWHTGGTPGLFAYGGDFHRRSTTPDP